MKSIISDSNTELLIWAFGIVTLAAIIGASIVGGVYVEGLSNAKYIEQGYEQEITPTGRKIWRKSK